KITQTQKSRRLKNHADSKIMQTQKSCRLKNHADSGQADTQTSSSCKTGNILEPLWVGCNELLVI
ncbi:MAG: hypothetical protein AAFV72_25285, partial [Cyanobacteria bacterium J06635_1]